ncbi:FAD-dependent oxidoreductase [Actinomycetospora soli]|uniref:FAD-dependent oxidoreductase n=1 Tax=Actinomycetospora soli TaxID=2893887 RepID=UPI001E45D02C|nr:FAD-dependent oxidoreductase [Actinomycetospora soli]MCD2185714.1 FAD-binding oxidoreductase [Actinomycetospora soli]
MPTAPTPRAEVVVVGAGVVGLTTAAVLAGTGLDVEVWSADDPLDTASARAAGVWTPMSQAPLASSLAWAERSLQEFCGLSRVPGSGVALVEGLTLTPHDTGGHLPPLTRLSPDLRDARPDELPAGFPAGLRYRLPRIDMPRYVPWLVDRLTASGGRIRRHRVESLAEPLASAPVVVNASGLGARDLGPDPAVRPVFSQYVVTDNPGLTRVVVDTTDQRRWVSIIPHPDRVHLGGVRVSGRDDDRPDRELASDVLRRCREVEPALVDARVQRVDTGLLPSRPTMRVETEQRDEGLVVHAYGHASGGVTVSWGVAHAVAELVASGRDS